MVAPSWFSKLFQTGIGNSETRLHVYYEEILVGTLIFDKGNFVFSYSDQCPSELRIKGMDKAINKTKHLPPFFSTRLPSESRPEIREAIKRLGTKDPIRLLGELSKKSPVSPYQFKLDNQAA